MIVDLDVMFPVYIYIRDTEDDVEPQMLIVIVSGIDHVKLVILLRHTFLLFTNVSW